MKQAVVLGILANIFGFADARASSSPFVGQHKDASVIEHGNGRVTTRIKPVAAPFNKHEDMLVKEGLFKNRS